MGLEPENSWDLALASGVPTNLSLKMGVGQGSVDLSEVDVRSLEAVTGVGETEIDLSGPRSADVSGTITTGVGETTVRLPSNVGVQITGGGDGLGNVSSKGFTGRQRADQRRVGPAGTQDHAQGRARRG